MQIFHEKYDRKIEDYLRYITNRNRGISIFVGALFTLGGASTISNLVGGFIIIYTRAFRVGDRSGESWRAIAWRKFVVVCVRLK